MVSVCFMRDGTPNYAGGFGSGAADWTFITNRSSAYPGYGDEGAFRDMAITVFGKCVEAGDGTTYGYQTAASRTNWVWMGEF